MPEKKEIKEQLARESHWRERLGVPAFAGGFLYFLSTIVVTATLKGLPTVGLLQGVAPALRGEANPLVSPRVPEVKYISHHATALIAGSTLKSLALLVIVLILLLLVEATRFRRPESLAAARWLVLIGGVALAVVNVAHQAITAAKAHSLAIGHDFSSHAVDQALTKGTVNVAGQYIDLLAALALMIGMIAVCVNGIRVGLITRWLGVIGIFTAVLLLIPIGGATLEIVPAFWMIAMAVLYMGRWPGGDLPAWTTGEARPWPSQAQVRAERQEKREDKQQSNGQAAIATASGDVAPEPSQPASSESRSSRKRRGKRGAKR
jgi:hypothetical protein